MNLIPWRQKREGEPGASQSERGLTRLRQDMDTLFDQFFRDPWGGPMESAPAGVAMPRMNLAESENQVTVTLELPGVDPKDVDIDVAGELLTVHGEKKLEKEEKQHNYHYVERQFGSFHRAVRLPSTVDPQKGNATFRNGVLTIAIDKRPDAKAKRIRVRDA